ncbi:MAG: 50S ribosomal protein L21 [Alphaproteobacteria bacterium]
MYAVIKTGGKQYRVQAGDVLVVEKLAGEPGANLTFSDVLMIGDDAGTTVGAPTVAGAVVTGALLETRKGEKVKIFKKIRRQGYRRTQGHRQAESVVRVLSVAGLGKTDKWDGELDLTPLAERQARARNLARGMTAAVEKTAAKLARKPAAPKKAAAPKPAPKAEAAPAAEVETKSAAPKKAAAPKAQAKAAPKKPAAPKATK